MFLLSLKLVLYAEALDENFRAYRNVGRSDEDVVFTSMFSREVGRHIPNVKRMKEHSAVVVHRHASSGTDVALRFSTKSVVLRVFQASVCELCVRI